ncbi:MAG: transposase, partial [Bacteroidota bacterium]
VGKQYEFVSKVTLATLPSSNVVVGVNHFTGNPHDSKTLSVALASIGRMFGKEFSRVLVDRGYRGHKKVGDSEVILLGRCTGKRGYGVSGISYVVGVVQG